MSSSTISRIFNVSARAASRIPGSDRVKKGAVKGKGPAREILPVERMFPEALEGLTHLFEKLAKQRIMGGVVDGEVEG